jgi:circadian clock protein KaiB
MPHLPTSYKGIALFTPGGDLVYSVDPSKQERWHAQLCQTLQTKLNLPEVPYFLVPCFAATVDQVWHPQTGQTQVFAEIAPNIWRYRALLTALFAIDSQAWQIAPMPPGVCDDRLMRHYQDQFPSLWECHNLTIRLEHPQMTSAVSEDTGIGYVFRLFVAGYNRGTEKTLTGLHRLLEGVLQDKPYTLIVIDVLKQPEEAEVHQITATPTLMKVYPPPMQRLVGNLLMNNLDSSDRLLQLLGGL